MAPTSMVVTTEESWRGAIPLGWTLKQLKWAITFQRGHDLPAEDRQPGQIPVVAGGGIIGWHDVAQAVGPGIVTGRYGTIGEFHLVEQDYWPLNTCLYSIDLHGNHAGFLRYLLEPLAPLFHLNAAKSAVPGVDRSDIHTITVAVPPLPSQRAIAHYLDRETARIDALIVAKERVLGLLAEKRRSLITRAVTRGLDPHAPLRDSGIPWLGEIPAHWVMCHLRRVLASVDYGISETIESSGSVAVLRMGDIQDGEIDYSNVGFVDEVDERVLLKPGDLVFNRTNSLDRIGKVGLFQGRGEYPVSFASYLVRFRCREIVLPEYLNWLLNSALALAWGRAQALPAIGQANLNPNRYGYLPIPLPSLSEQERIIASISESTARIDAVRSATKATISLLTERRAALIAAAVTGKISVEAEA